MKVENRANRMACSYIPVQTIVLEDSQDSSRLWLMTEEDFKELGVEASYEDVMDLLKTMKNRRWSYGVVTAKHSFAIDGFEYWRVGRADLS